MTVNCLAIVDVYSRSVRIRARAEHSGECTLLEANAALVVHGCHTGNTPEDIALRSRPNVEKSSQ